MTMVGWQQPITIGRHAYGDIYNAQDIIIPSGGGELKLIFVPSNGGKEQVYSVHQFKEHESGAAVGLFNKDDVS
jgi:isocitrate dehydrogenase